MTEHLWDVVLWLVGSCIGWFSLSQILHTDLLERVNRKPGQKVVQKSDALGGGQQTSHFFYWAFAFLFTLFGLMTIDGMRGRVQSTGVFNFPVAWCRLYTGWPPDLSGEDEVLDYDPNMSAEERRRQAIERGN